MTVVLLCRHVLKMCLLLNVAVVLSESNSVLAQLLDTLLIIGSQLPDNMAVTQRLIEVACKVENIWHIQRKYKSLTWILNDDETFLSFLRILLTPILEYVISACWYSVVWVMLINLWVKRAMQHLALRQLLWETPRVSSVITSVTRIHEFELQLLKRWWARLVLQ